MKWFKHDSDANRDEKLQNVLLDYGLEGYGLYWYCLELITYDVDQHNLNFDLRHDARIIARNVGSTEKRIEEMMKYFIEIGLFECSQGHITCLKLLKRLDQSMTSKSAYRAAINTAKEQLKLEKLINTAPKGHDEVMNGSCHGHDRVMTGSWQGHELELEEETEKEKEKDKNILISDADRNAFENIFWPAYPRKVNKQAAFKSFKTRAKEWVKENKSTVQAFAEMLVKDLERRKGWFGSDKLHPTTYLNQKRWLDEPEGGNNNQDSNVEGKKLRRIVGKSGQIYERMLTDDEYNEYLRRFAEWQKSQHA